MVDQDTGAPVGKDIASTTTSAVWRKVILFSLTRVVIAGLSLAAAFIFRDVIANGVLALPRDAAASRGLVLIMAASCRAPLKARNS